MNTPKPKEHKADYSKGNNTMALENWCSVQNYQPRGVVSVYKKYFIRSSLLIALYTAWTWMDITIKFHDSKYVCQMSIDSHANRFYHMKIFPS